MSPESTLVRMSKWEVSAGDGSGDGRWFLVKAAFAPVFITSPGFAAALCEDCVEGTSGNDSRFFIRLWRWDALS